MAYRLALPPDLEKIHNVFHVSMLRRYRSDPSHVVFTETIELRPDLTYKSIHTSQLKWGAKAIFGRFDKKCSSSSGAKAGAKKSRMYNDQPKPVEYN